MFKKILLLCFLLGFLANVSAVPLTILEPSHGATLEGTVTVGASYAVNKTIYFRTIKDGVSKNIDNCRTGSGAIDFCETTWDTTLWENGTYTLQAEVAGSPETKTQIQVKINNASEPETEGGELNPVHNGYISYVKTPVFDRYDPYDAKTYLQVHYRSSQPESRTTSFLRFDLEGKENITNAYLELVQLEGPSSSNCAVLYKIPDYYPFDKTDFWNFDSLKKQAARLPCVSAGSITRVKIPNILIEEGKINAFMILRDESVIVKYASMKNSDKKPVLILEVPETDNNPPDITLTFSPLIVSSASGVVEIKAVATDESGISELKLSVDGDLKTCTRTSNTATSSTCEYDWDTTTASNYGHVIRVEAIDTKGNSASSEQTIQVDNDIEISVPTNFTAEPGSIQGEIDLSWNSVSHPDFEHYKIFFGTSSADTFLSNTLETFYTHAALTQDQTYFYKIQACDSAEDFCSEFSSVVSAVPAETSSSDQEAVDGYILWNEKEDTKTVSSGAFVDTLALKYYSKTYSERKPGTDNKFTTYNKDIESRIFLVFDVTDTNYSNVKLKLKKNIVDGTLLASDCIQVFKLNSDFRPLDESDWTLADFLQPIAEVACNDIELDVNEHISLGANAFMLKMKRKTTTNDSILFDSSKTDNPPVLELLSVFQDVFGRHEKVPAFEDDSVTEEVSGNTVTFVLQGNAENKVFFFYDSIYVSSFDPAKNYFIKIPSDVTLVPCPSGSSSSICTYADSDLQALTFNSTISGVILEGTIDLRGESDTGSLIIQGDLNVNGTGKIITKGSDGVDGNRLDCDFTDSLGLIPKASGTIEVIGKTFVSSGSELILDSSGGNGGNGADGFEESDNCKELDGQAGASGSNGSEILLHDLFLEDLSKISFNSSGGDGGTGGTSVAPRADGLDGSGGNAGNITVNKTLIEGTPELNFSVLKGTGLIDGLDAGIEITGCNLLNLQVSVCEAETFTINSNDANFLMDELVAGACAGTETQIQAGPNSFCEGQPNKMQAIFSLTGTVKTFDGENLFGSLGDFDLRKELGEEISYDLFGSSNFYDGFFNFIFGDTEGVPLELDFGSFTYLLSFLVNITHPIDTSETLKGNFSLVSTYEKKLMRLPFNGRVKDIVQGRVDDIEIIDPESNTVVYTKVPQNFSNEKFSITLMPGIYPNKLYKIKFRVCNVATSQCNSFEFNFFTWKKLWPGED